MILIMKTSQTFIPSCNSQRCIGCTIDTVSNILHQVPDKVSLGLTWDRNLLESVSDFYTEAIILQIVAAMSTNTNSSFEKAAAVYCNCRPWTQQQ